MTSFDRTRARDSAEMLRTKRRELSTLEVPRGRGWSPLREKVAEAVYDQPQTIGAVVAKLCIIQAILDELPPGPRRNRVSAFNKLYTRITRRVEGALLDGVNSPAFLELLDIEFAKRYFCALDQWNNDLDETPDVWEVLFKRAGDQKMSRLTAAMLGVNAHINHDLALALVGTWNSWGAPEPGDDTIHPDYLLVNEIFYQEIPPLRRSFSTTWQLEIDDFVGGLDDWTQRTLVTVTRARAWDQGRDLWLLRNDPEEFEDARHAMDRAASLLAEFAIAGDRVVNAIGATVAGAWRLLK
jgi:hypothetical protein